MASANWGPGGAMPAVGFYNNGGYWIGGVVPNEQATFGTSQNFVVQITQFTNVNNWLFVGVQPYIFTVTNTATLNFNGAGITGSPTASLLSNNGILTFNGSSTAGQLVIGNTSAMVFADASTAGFASINNQSSLRFTGSSTAGNANINVTKTGTLEFADGANGGNANIAIEVATGIQQGRVIFSGDGPLHDHKVSVGSIGGRGSFDLGSNQLTVGNSLDTVVYGDILGTAAAGLVKVGTGSLSLNGHVTYGGTTRVEEGRLVVGSTLNKVVVDGQVATLLGTGTLGTTTIKEGLLSAGSTVGSASLLNTGTLDVQHRGRLMVNMQDFADSYFADIVQVQGKVKLAGTLTVNTPQEYDTLPRHKHVIIDNDGKDKVKGQFSGGLTGKYAEGEAFATEYQVYSITYKGGTGNDVVLRSEGVMAVDGTDASEIYTTTTAPFNVPLLTKRADFVSAWGGNDFVQSGGGNDTVSGGLGMDTLDGGKGNDLVGLWDAGGAIQVTLRGSKAATVKVNGVAEDRVKNFENVVGGNLADKITGDGKANIIYGGIGIDTLKGGGGSDVLAGGDLRDILTGGSGRDRFLFENALSHDWLAQDADVIKDFKHGQDKIVLDGFVFHEIGNKLDKGEFLAKKGANAARDGNDHIIYNTKSGRLFYDEDGKGGEAAVLVATLSGHPTLSASDFLIV